MKNSWKAYPPFAIYEIFKFGWKGVMTIEHSPLRKLHPQVAHMLFLILAFMWSGIFAVMIGSLTAFGISAVVHIMLISGIAITFLVFNQSEKNPESVNQTVFKLRKGYHSYPRARQTMVIDGKPLRLDPKDPGGEHE